ncbi:endo alpha-1,4 polygalactosaminidase [Nocardioides dongkuii]|uniref:endo alpha-1,4 polygalactosaminidase n=1 Tax=Nocardioides dongkuii TaxID=2760089 RepID=UPI0029D41588|nr:endo alpha-1,4 polygalactosaminidase [Nocardioides dongkuii]
MRRFVTTLLALVTTTVAAPAYAVEQLPVGTDVDYQLGGVRAVPDRVGIVVRDRTEAPTGRYDVCYVNGFQTQPGARGFWRDRMHLVLQRDGRPVVDEDWGEWLLDLRTSAKRRQLARIVGRWTAGCARDGFDAVEYDNLDSFTRSHRLLKRRHAVAYARLLVRAAHRSGLAAGQKNLAGLRGSRIGFDFAVAEECGRYDECGRYVAAYGRRVVVVEYRRRDFRATCAEHGDRLPVVLRDRDLTPRGLRAWC